MQPIKPKLYSRVLAKKKVLDSLRPLPAAVVRKLQEQMQIEFTYNSNAIEGNTLNLRETQLIIQEGSTIHGKSLREHLEARNHPKALTYIGSLTKRNLTEADILKVHSLIMQGIDESAGNYRTGQVRVAGANFLPPPPQRIRPMINELQAILKNNPDELKPIELAAYLHHQLSYIHPFIDGNGRTARLLMNAQLLKYGYPFTIILKVDRPRYLRDLSEADHGNTQPFTQFIARAVERSLDLYLAALQKDADILTLAEAAKQTPYSQEYLSLLARRGDIGAFKLGRNWVITMSALSDYLKS